VYVVVRKKDQFVCDSVESLAEENPPDEFFSLTPRTQQKFMGLDPKCFPFKLKILRFSGLKIVCCQVLPTSESVMTRRLKM
jgi:hypothetical protein